MTTFDQREQAFEAKHVHDEELKFKATVRRNKWLGLWAAEKLGMSASAAEDYASELIAAELEEEPDDVIFKRIRADFDAANIDLSDHQIRRQMAELFEKAKEEIMTVAAEAKKQGDAQGQ